ncbi:hypothetical protein N1F78_00250 [Seonamhaeicola sp. MEBiC1930]|uniref:hypothetical protein n=1 Tax=Seonamhaeicola sp. MEBiC01930 TaxID=2976768 RepID=UPI003252A17C
MKKHIYKGFVLIKRMLLFPIKAINFYNIGNEISNSIVINMSPQFLLAFQYDNKSFIRKDIIIRFLAMEDKFISKNNEGIQLYLKLMKMRYKEKPFKNKISDSLDGVYNNMKENGYDKSYPIKVDSNFRLLDGSHRMAAALINNVEEVSVDIHSFGHKIDFSSLLLKQYNFSQKEISLINKKESNLFFEQGIYFPVIIWPPAMTFVDDIEKDLDLTIKRTYDLEFDDSDFYRFVREIYKIDDIAEWKVEKKIEAMHNYHLKVKVFFIEMGNPNFRKKSINANLISKKGEKLKRKIRLKYKTKINNYIHDIIVHTGDNFGQNKKIVELTKKYEQPIK